MSKELKPCPFCGYEDIGVYGEHYFVGSVKVGFLNTVMCQNCRAAVIDNDPAHCLNDAIDKWNRRTLL